MTEGKCRVTTLSRDGMPSVEDVFREDLWFFPAGLPHSLQGMGPDGAEFVIAFDDGRQSESNTMLLTDWFAHTPPDVLAKNFGVARETFDDIPLHNLWIFPGEEPGDSGGRPGRGRRAVGRDGAGDLPDGAADAGV